MNENTVYVRATRRQLRQVFATIPSAALGQAGARAAANAMMTRLGLTLLGRIKKAFIDKSRGGTDEAGDRWAPLSPKTIAYSRRHPGVPKAKDRAAARPSWALSEEQRGRWWQVYRQSLARYKGDKGAAARAAWFVLKGEGAETLLDKYGKTQVDILRDTGLLLNSLSPGVDSEHQVFRLGTGEVIVGTNRKGAAAHHSGIPGRLPQRRLWPEVNRWPTSWWIDILESARTGLVDITLHLMGKT